MVAHQVLLLSEWSNRKHFSIESQIRVKSSLTANAVIVSRAPDSLETEEIQTGGMTCSK